jgi:hypothetical protein
MNPAHQARWHVGVVDGQSAAEREAVVALRRKAYAQAGEFEWNDLSTLGWTQADEDGVVLGLWGHDASQAGQPGGTAAGTATLLCTLRASVFADAGSAENFLEHALQGVACAWPAAVLSRAATLPGQHRQGLMALMRCAYLQALPAAHVRGVLAVVYETAPRLNSMQAVGYTLTVPLHSWDSEARATTPPLLAHLDEAHFDTALQAARKLAQSALPYTAFDRSEIETALLCSSLLARRHRADEAAAGANVSAARRAWRPVAARVGG